MFYSYMFEIDNEYFMKSAKLTVKNSDTCSVEQMATFYRKSNRYGNICKLKIAQRVQRIKT